MKSAFFVLVSFFAGTLGSVLEIIESPDSYKTPEEATLKLSELPLIAAQVLGLSTKRPSGWSGQGDLLNRPECVAMFLVTTKDHAKPNVLTKQSYVLTPDGSPSFKEVSAEIMSAFDKKGFTLMDVSKTVEGSHDVDLNQMIPDEPVKTKSSPLHEELVNMKAVAFWLDKNSAEARNFVPDLYTFEVQGLLPIIHKNGAQSAEGKAALEELSDTIKEVSGKLSQVYEKNCFIAMVTQPVEVHQRKKRETDTPSGPEDVPGLYDFYKPDYPVAFNIILWTMVFISLTVLFVSVGMWFMDPGKDSIIYRMTMQRAKMD